MEILVDSSVILDIVTEDENWFAWSAETLADCAKSNILAVNPIETFEKCPYFVIPAQAGIQNVLK